MGLVTTNGASKATRQSLLHVGLYGGQHVGVVADSADVHQTAVWVDRRDAGGIAFAPGKVDADEVHRLRLWRSRREVRRRAVLISVSCVSVSIPNVLANRYASPDMVGIWAPEAKIIAERRLWLAVLRAQAELGVPVPEEVVADYERVLDDVDLASIAARERTLRHDVKARIEEFNALAGHRARAQGDDEPRPDRERRAAADPAIAGIGVLCTGLRWWRGSPSGRSATAIW